MGLCARFLAGPSRLPRPTTSRRDAIAVARLCGGPARCRRQPRPRAGRDRRALAHRSPARRTTGYTHLLVLGEGRQAAGAGGALTRGGAGCRRQHHGRGDRQQYLVRTWGAENRATHVTSCRLRRGPHRLASRSLGVSLGLPTWPVAGPLRDHRPGWLCPAPASAGVSGSEYVASLWRRKPGETRTGRLGGRGPHVSSRPRASQRVSAFFPIG